jgi:hypothetical protein
MPEEIFKFIKKDSFHNEVIMMALTETTLQIFAEEKIDRQLSNIELNRFAMTCWDSDEVNHAMYDIMNSMIQEITNEKDIDWSYADSRILNETDKKRKVFYLKEHKELSQCDPSVDHLEN